MIKLITVIGHGAELIPHFIKHYEQYVDEIKIVIYKTDKYPNIEDEVRDKISQYDFVNVVKVINDRIYDWNKVTFLYNDVKSRYPNDWWVVADIDEFHLYPYDNLRNIIKICEENNWELVRGGFIDRIGLDGTFPELNDTSIWEQFPNAGFFRYPMSDACPNKICILKGNIELTSGQHYVKIHGVDTWRWQGWNHPLIAPYDKFSVQVHHFKWDSTSIERIKNVAAIGQKYAFSDEYAKMYTALSKSKFKVNITDSKYFFEEGLTYPKFDLYKGWNKLIKKIIST